MAACGVTRAARTRSTSIRPRRIENNPLIQQMQADMAKIVPVIEVLRNQGPNSVNGGGTSVVPPLPPVSLGGVNNDAAPSRPRHRSPSAPAPTAWSSRSVRMPMPTAMAPAMPRAMPRSRYRRRQADRWHIHSAPPVTPPARSRPSRSTATSGPAHIPSRSTS